MPIEVSEKEKKRDNILLAISMISLIVSAIFAVELERTEIGLVGIGIFFVCLYIKTFVRVN